MILFEASAVENGKLHLRRWHGTKALDRLYELLTGSNGESDCVTVLYHPCIPVEIAETERNPEDEILPKGPIRNPGSGQQ